MTQELATEVAASRRTPTWSERIVARAARAVDTRSSRRNFLARTALVASAVAVAPKRFALEPIDAATLVCGSGADCNSGWTSFCCSINNGVNLCPPGSIAAGWWKNDTSPFCSGGARYIVDCNSTCGSCAPGADGVCDPECAGFTCHCNTDPATCDHRRVACNRFRYGQCNMQIAHVGPVVCRVTTCVPPWQWDPSCSTTAATDERTASHTAPCVHGDFAAALHAADDYAFGPGSAPTRQP